MTSPLFVTRDETLLDELLRLAAAAGVTPDVAHDGVAALRGWSGASLVLVGADVAEEVARTLPPRRDGVHVVVWGDVAGRARSGPRWRSGPRTSPGCPGPGPGWSSR